MSLVLINQRALIQDLRRQYSGCVPLSKQEKLSELVREATEDKWRSAQLLREAEDKRMEAEAAAEELALKRDGMDEVVAVLKQGSTAATKQVRNAEMFMKEGKVVVVVVKFIYVRGLMPSRTEMPMHRTYCRAFIGIALFIYSCIYTYIFFLFLLELFFKSRLIKLFLNYIYLKNIIKITKRISLFCSYTNKALLIYKNKALFILI